MKIKASILMICTSFAVFVLTGCVPENDITLFPNQTKTPSFIISPNPTASPKSTLVLPPSLTPVPNMRPDKIPQLIVALQDDACKLPCYLGIVPGKTGLQEGIAILENLGGIRFISGTGPNPYQRQSDGAFRYEYGFGIGEPLPEGRIIYHNVSLITDNNLVQAIEVSAAPNVYESLEPATKTYQDYWKRYALKEIFLQMGEPENIYVAIKEHSSSAALLVLVYDKQSIQIDMYDEWLKKKLCPNNQVDILHMILSHSNSPFRIDTDDHIPPTDRESYLPVEEMFGVTIHSFYEKVLADPTVCFESKIVNP